MSATARIKKFLKSVPPGQLIRNKDLEPFAGRDLYDKVLSNEFKAGNLIRFTSGVYTRPGGEFPSKNQIAEFKTSSCGKTIYQSDAPDDCVYFTDGAPSSFQFQGETIRFIRQSARMRRGLHSINSICQSEHAEQSPLSGTVQQFANSDETLEVMVPNSKRKTDEPGSTERITCLVNGLIELVESLSAAFQTLISDVSKVNLNARTPLSRFNPYCRKRSRSSSRNRRKRFRRFLE